MINKKLNISFFLIVAIAISTHGQGNTPRALKEAYANKFLIGAAND